MLGYKDLSDEQQDMIRLVLEGNNVLVDACIGSGKTTNIQVLCDMVTDKHILYLTYNKLLKADARSKIKSNKNREITNYHTYVARRLHQAGIPIRYGADNNMLQTFVSNADKFNLSGVDLLVIDEYQDIDDDISEILSLIKSANPYTQIVAVGDMEQKIYDYTRLDVHSFIEEFLGAYKFVSFTKCFRLSKDLASMLGNVWHKSIVGVNSDCKVQKLSFEDTFEFLKGCECKDILCLGYRNGKHISLMLNLLEKYDSDKFNKNTIWASIRESEEVGVDPKSSSAIFTSYDSSKGMERNVCCIFDFTTEYWGVRSGMVNTRYDILRNIFCVAASRGKKNIIFVESGNDDLLNERVLGTPFRTNTCFKKAFQISNMFEFKFKEDLDVCMKYLKIEELECTDTSVIDVKLTDGLIDLSPCIGILQEASYFGSDYIDRRLFNVVDGVYNGLYKTFIDDLDALLHNEDEDDFLLLQKKVLACVTVDTKQYRYFYQVNVPFISEEELGIIHERLSTQLDRNSKTQGDLVLKCQWGREFKDNFLIAGRYDAYEEGVWELKFVSELSQEHFLQCAMYAAIQHSNGILWNVKTNRRYSVVVKDSGSFISQVVRTITKGILSGSNCEISRLRNNY